MGLLTDLLGDGNATSAALQYRTGEEYPVSGGNTGTGTRPNGYGACLPLVVHDALPIDRISVEVTTAGNAGALLRLGIYADDDGTPGALVLDAGTVAADTTGVKSATVAQALTASTTYWFVAVVQSAGTTTPVMRCLTASQLRPGIPFSTTANRSHAIARGSTAFGTSGALPSTAPPTLGTDTAPVIGLRVA